MKRCTSCSEEKPLDEFHKHSKTRDGRQHWCKPCKTRISAEWNAANPGRVKEKSKARYLVKRAQMDELKSTPCVDCGVAYPPYVMDFDHREGVIKNFNVSQAMGWSLERLLEEVAKCDVVCANCHRERTFGSRRASARLESVNKTKPVFPAAVRDSVWTGEDVESRWPSTQGAVQAAPSAAETTGELVERLDHTFDTHGRIVPRFAEEDGECECPKAQSEERNYSLYDFGTFAMRESDYENRRSMGLWNDPVKARKTLDWCLQNGWARRVD